MDEISEMSVIIENQPNKRVVAPAKNTAKKLRFLIERNVPKIHTIATSRNIIANTIL